MSGVSVLAVDHDEAFRRAAHVVVNAAPGFEWVAQATSAEEALEVALQLRPDLVLLAVSMPGIDGFETSRRLMAALPKTVVVLVSAGEEPDAEMRMASGAAAFMHRDALTPASLRALWEELGGR
jgi:two-component system, NarL family, invasion response regulator UvrY